MENPPPGRIVTLGGEPFNNSRLNGQHGFYNSCREIENQLGMDFAIAGKPLLESDVGCLIMVIEGEPNVVLIVILIRTMRMGLAKMRMNESSCVTVAKVIVVHMLERCLDRAQQQPCDHGEMKHLEH